MTANQRLPWHLQLRTPSGVVVISRRPVLSVRKRIINTPVTATAAAAAAAATAAADSSTQISTSKYSRLRSRPAATTAAATATTTTTNTLTKVTTVGSSSSSNNNNNSYLSKLRAKSTAASAAEAAATSSSPLAAASSATSSNDITKKQHKFQPASSALRRQFQTRRLTTTAASNAASDESATETPRTQNPLFKRRLTLNSTPAPSRATTTFSSTAIGSLETTTNLYADGSEDANDQVARSSIHTSRFNHIAEQARPQPVQQEATTEATAPVPAYAARRQPIPRPRRPQPTALTPTATPTPTPTHGNSKSAVQRQSTQSRRRPHKYIEVYSRPPSKPALAQATSQAARRQQTIDYEYYDDGHTSVAPFRHRQQPQPQPLEQSKQPVSQVKVIVHGRGIIECLDQGNFPHPLSCRKFISCAKFEETGGIVGWEYTCPKGLGYDALDGMCTWAAAAGQNCRE